MPILPSASTPRLLLALLCLLNMAPFLWASLHQPDRSMDPVIEKLADFDLPPATTPSLSPEMRPLLVDPSRQIESVTADFKLKMLRIAYDKKSATAQNLQTGNRFLMACVAADFIALLFLLSLLTGSQTKPMKQTSQSTC